MILPVQVVHQFSGENAGGFNPLAMYGIEVDSVLRDHQIHQDLDQYNKMSAEDRNKQCVSCFIFIWRMR